MEIRKDCGRINEADREYMNLDVENKTSKVETCIVDLFIKAAENHQLGMPNLPGIRLARGKFELTNQDSAGGKNSSVLM